MSEYNPTEAIAAQDRYCEEHELPCFAPLDGICPSCGRNIYLPISGSATPCLSGITVSMAATRQITGCPHCRCSFVE